MRIGKYAIVPGANLSYTNLRGTDLRDADLHGANVSDADLQDANLSGADLSGANLSYANLRDVNLHGADLRDANLRYANLHGANLHGANLVDGEGVVRLPVGDPRGYDCVAVRQDEGWRIVAGCRWYTTAEAAAHWGEGYEGDPKIADRYLYAIDWLLTHHGVSNP